jgi:hypothetical protein
MRLATTQDSHLPVFFNVDTSVGKGGQNSNQDDILLVQFLLQATAEASPAAQGAVDGTRQRAASLPATGIADAVTTVCIQAWQEASEADPSRNHRRWARQSRARHLLRAGWRVDDRGSERDIPQVLPEDLAAPAGPSEMPGPAEGADVEDVLSRSDGRQERMTALSAGAPPRES